MIVIFASYILWGGLFVTDADVTDIETQCTGVYIQVYSALLQPRHTDAICHQI